MKYFILFFLLIGAFNSFAQQPDVIISCSDLTARETVCITDTYILIDSTIIIDEKMAEKQKKLKSGFTGFALSFLPVAGHFYAGKTNRGLIFTGISCVFFASLAAGGLIMFNDEDNAFGYFFTSVGMIGMSVTAIWKMVDVQKIIIKQNASVLNRPVSVQLAPILFGNHQFATQHFAGATFKITF